MDISEKSPQNQAAKRLAFTSGHLRTVLECLICAASGALYSTIFAGVSWYALAWVGLIPLIAYIYYLISYVSLDIIRALLSLPQKLDELKK